MQTPCTAFAQRSASHVRVVPCAHLGELHDHACICLAGDKHCRAAASPHMRRGVMLCPLCAGAARRYAFRAHSRACQLASRQQQPQQRAQRLVRRAVADSEAVAPPGDALSVIEDRFIANALSLARAAGPAQQSAA